MKYFAIDDRIGRELFDRFIGFYNSYSDQQCTITLNTIGGDTHTGDTIIHMVNSMPDCTIILWTAFSVGFDIAYQTNCKKTLVLNSRAMIHQVNAGITMNVDKSITYLEDRCQIKNLSGIKKANRKRFEKVLTKKEYNKYLKGDDVYLPLKRLKQIFPNAPIINT